MKKMVLLVLSVAVVVFLCFSGVYAGDISAPSAKGPQWDKWSPRNNTDVGTPAFKAISSQANSMIYGFRGAVVFDAATKQTERVRMATITRTKVEGFVNQINNSFALAAGLHEVAVYDFSKHKWFVLPKVTPDDSTGMLKQNFIVTPQFVQVKQLGGPFWKYTSAAGWQK